MMGIANKQRGARKRIKLPPIERLMLVGLEEYEV